MVDGEKMSKSLNNFTSLTDLLDKADGRAYRLLVLRSHYRVPVEVTADTIADAERGLARLDTFARRFGLRSPAGPVRLDDGHEADLEAVARFVAFMDDDLQTPQALGLVFELVGEANAAMDAGDEDRARVVASTVVLLTAAMGLTLDGTQREIDDDTAALVAERDLARATKDFARSDALRDELAERGWLVEDTPEGTVLHR